MSKKRKPTDQYENSPYIPALTALGVKLSREGVPLAHAVIAHDDWCDLLNEKGYCNCDPDVRLEEAPSD
tara:strand:- start:1916 stop:2122 length:207 start_codon:yes stop_codon:yes gene_type:complete